MGIFLQDRKNEGNVVFLEENYFLHLKYLKTALS